jgi:hypothetical protein
MQLLLTRFTFSLPALGGIHVENYTVKNSTHWLWMLANPTATHNNYAADKRAIKEMLTSAGDEKR